MSPESYRLLIHKGPNEGNLIELSKEVTLIGRDVTNEVILADAEVSRRHARLTETRSGYVLEDLGSTNGTYVNEERLSGPRILIPGDEIALGNHVILTFEEVSPEEAEGEAMASAAKQPAAELAVEEETPLAAMASDADELTLPEAEARPRAWLFAGLGCLFVVVSISALFWYLDMAHPDKLYGPLVRLLSLLGLN
jgi:hypothetical protein